MIFITLSLSVSLHFISRSHQKSGVESRIGVQESVSDLVTTGGSEMRAVTIAIQDWPNPLGILSVVSTAAMRRFRLVQRSGRRWPVQAGSPRPAYGNLLLL